MISGTRKVIDKYFSVAGVASILLMAAALVVLLTPIIYRGSKAFIFRATVEHRRFMLEKFERGNRDDVEGEVAEARQAREPVYAMVDAFRKDVASMGFVERRKYAPLVDEFDAGLTRLLGPRPGTQRPGVDT